MATVAMNAVSTSAVIHRHVCEVIRVAHMLHGVTWVRRVVHQMCTAEATSCLNVNGHTSFSLHNPSVINSFVTGGISSIKYGTEGVST